MSQPCSWSIRAKRDGVVGLEPAGRPSRSPRSGRSSAYPRATPRGRRRTPRAGTGRARRARSRTRRRARWPAATGSSTADSRGRSAARAGRTRLRPRPRAAATNCSQHGVHGRLGSSRAAPGCAVRRAAARARSPASCRPAAARRSRPTSASSSPCDRSGRAARRSRNSPARATNSTIRFQARTCASRIHAGAAGRDPSLGRDADHLGHHQSGAAERARAEVDEVEVARGPVDGGVHVHRRHDHPVGQLQPRAAQNGSEHRRPRSLGDAPRATNSGSRSRRLS